ncbi:GNAT family N-acetyltransferase [Pseudoduganella sp. UC29_106]|uniref:GNAT family N-acetyltransferase n=1 Tax=Pseudoduganella sp. UC29_106 TaxID=3374553 RepID=UPI003757F3D4
MQELKNPLWAALTSAQQHFSIAAGAARRYPADVAPFLAVAEDGMPLSAADLEDMDGDYYVLDVFPALPEGWSLQPISNVLQMVYEGGPVGAPEESAIRELASDDPQMVELTNVAFPGYFRARTGLMGRYVGIHEEGRLVSMSGERMDLGALREVSAVCTHPDFTGRGLARLLILDCLRHMQRQGVQPFLHVGAANKRAQALYEALGFRPTRELKHAKVISPSR